MILGAVKPGTAVGFSPEQRARGAAAIRRKQDAREAAARGLIDELKAAGWTATRLQRALEVSDATARKWWRGDQGPAPALFLRLEALVRVVRAGTVADELAPHVRPPALLAGAAAIGPLPRPPAEAEDEELALVARRWSRLFDAAIGKRDLAIAIVLEFHERLCRLEDKARLSPRGAGLRALEALVRDAFP